MNKKRWTQLLAAGGLVTLFAMTIGARIADARQCGCEVCLCYKMHPTLGTCNVPSLEPCGCWLCPD